jgi:hypothetical protein
MSAPYLVSRHEDMRNPVEVFSASGHQHAADLAEQAELIDTSGVQTLFVQCPRGEVREVEVEGTEEIVTEGLDDSEPEEML